MKRHLPLLIAALLADATVPGFAADEIAKPNIRIEVQMIALPEEQALPLMADLKSRTKIEAANEKIQELLTKGTAKLLGWPMIIMQSGQRAVVEGVRELRYATAFDAPAADVFTDNRPDQTFKVKPKWTIAQLEGIPTIFETRNIGVTMEVEAVLAPNGKMVDLNLIPQHTRLKGFNRLGLEKAPSGQKVFVEQPEFDVKKVTTSLTLQDGERVLLGVYRTDDPPNHLELFLLKVDVLPVK